MNFDRKYHIIVFIILSDCVKRICICVILALKVMSCKDKEWKARARDLP